MCGIFGAPEIDDSIRAMLPFLGIAMQVRGRDAWGASNGSEIIKHVGELTDTWIDERDKINQWTSGIFHTRGASTGSAKILNNAHPFCYDTPDGDKIIGIHNGAITNHIELDHKYNRNCSVDSMHLWMHRAEGKPWNDIEGWGNLAWWERDNQRRQVLNFARFNSNSLYVCRLKSGHFVFASEAQPIVIAARMCGDPVETTYVLDEYRHYWLAPDDRGVMALWRSENSLPFPRPYTSSVQNSGLSSTEHVTHIIYPRPSTLDGYCCKCTTVRVNTKTSLMCLSCFHEIVSKYYDWKFPAQKNNSGHFPGVN